MDSRKSLCRLFIQNHLKPSITKKRHNYAKYLTQNSLRLNVSEEGQHATPCQKPWIYQVVQLQQPQKVLAILLDAAVRRSTDDREDLKLNWESESLLCTIFSKNLLTTDRSLTEHQSLDVHLFGTFLNAGTTNDTFQQPGKQDSFRHLWKSSAIIYESSGSQFSKTTTGIQSGPDAFDESRLVVTLLTNLEDAEILCSFSIVLEGKLGKEMPESSRLESL